MKVCLANEHHSLDPFFIQSFLNDETYTAVAQMLELPSLSELKFLKKKNEQEIKSAFHETTNVTKETNTKESDDEHWDLSMNLGSIHLADVPRRRYKRNPYWKFINKPEKQVAVWRKQETMRAADILNASTLEKSKFITDKIIGDFIRWKESICDSKDVEIDEIVMRQLFEIGIKKPENPKIFRKRIIPRDIYEPKLMNKHPKCWTNVKKHFEASTSTAHPKPGSSLYKCSKDMMLKSNAKSKELSSSRGVTKRNTKELWSKCENNITEITGRVWQNKLNLTCVQAFCHYLEQNPHIKKPEYLLRMNMFSKGSEDFSV